MTLTFNVLRVLKHGMKSASKIRPNNTMGDVQYLGGYHDTCGGYHEYRGGRSVPLGVLE